MAAKTKKKTKKFQTYKAKKTVLKHVKSFLEDYSNWIQDGEFYRVPKNVDKNGPKVEEKIQKLLDQGKIDEEGCWLVDPAEARRANERCKVCVMGAVKMYSKTPKLAKQIIADLDTETVAAGYRNRETHIAIDEIFEINDGAAHSRPADAWKATLKIIDRTLEKMG